jgi:DNA-binding transcriptional ArsR family regulator
MTTQSPAEEALIEVVLAALADPTRRRILNGLSATGGGTATALAQNLPVTRQAVVKHLAVLHQAGLVVARKAGREVRYSVAPGPLETTARWMSELASDWDRPLQAVKRLAELGEPGPSEAVGLVGRDRAGEAGQG